ncbi:MAG: hypothetical protein J6W08_02950 [Alphaproteobacteria bacterium]|nr:hypothetical protein [Alphaproteobacteria bacterium]
MKKYLVLTSVLALAACGGGGHGGSSDAGFRSSNTALQSNSKITAMKSEILVGENGQTLSRSSSVTRNGLTYTSYMLDDVDFKLAQNAGGEEAIFNFKLDDKGRVDKAIAHVGGADLNMVRNGDTRYFNGAVFEYVKDGHTLKRVADNGQTFADLQAIETEAGLSGGRWDRMDQRWELVTSGKGTGLSYSDFGFLNTANVVKDKDITDAADLAAARNGTRTGANHRTYNEEEIRAQLDEQDYFMFAGGYAINSMPDQDMRFKGVAHGKVYSSVQADSNKSTYTSAYGFDPEEDGDSSLAFTTNNAELVFATGETPTETLVMPFGTDGAAFYDVTVTKTGNTVNFAFNPKDGATDDLYVAQKHRKDVAEDDVNTTANMGYYGVNSPQEAAGAVGYYAEKTLDAGDNARHEFEFEAAYGMKRQ